jgi:hypothetical protein
MLEFGGIYLDQDFYVTKCLDIFRKYELSFSWDSLSKKLSNGIFIAHKNSRFMKLYFDSYRDYNSTKWAYNSQLLPTRTILKKWPELVHLVADEFGPETTVICRKLHFDYDSEWQTKYYAIHLFMRGNKLTASNCFGGKKVVNYQFNDSVVKNLNTTFGEMARLVLDFEDSFK